MGRRQPTPLVNRQPFWTVRAAQADPAIGELLLYGNIGSENSLASWALDELTPTQFRADLAALGPIHELRLYINSGGGDVFAAQAIHSTIRRLNIPTVAIVDGIAASSASLVAVAADRVIMPQNAMMMIHRPWMQVAGNASDLKEWADRLDHTQDAMVPAYVSKTGLSAADVIDLLTAETWMTADEAVELGFADEIEVERRIAASVVSPGIWAVNGLQFDLSKFSHIPYLNRPKGAPLHGTHTGSHVHAHPAHGSQGGDVFHTHVHSHEGDYQHDHEHAPLHVAALNTAVVHAEAIPYANTGTAPESTNWSAPSLSDFTNKQWSDLTAAEQRHIARHYVWTDDGMPPESFSDLGGPHHRPNGISGDVGPAVWAAVSSGRMAQASWASDAGVRRHLAGHYREFGRQPPWELAEAEAVFRDYTRLLAERAGATGR